MVCCLDLVLVLCAILLLITPSADHKVGRFQRFDCSKKFRGLYNGQCTWTLLVRLNVSVCVCVCAAVDLTGDMSGFASSFASSDVSSKGVIVDIRHTMILAKRTDDLGLLEDGLHIAVNVSFIEGFSTAPIHQAPIHHGIVTCVQNPHLFCTKVCSLV